MSDIREEPALGVLTTVIVREGRARLIGWSLAVAAAFGGVWYWSLADSLTSMPYVMLGVPGVITIVASIFGLRSAADDTFRPTGHAMIRAIVDGTVTIIQTDTGSMPGISVGTPDRFLMLRTRRDEAALLFEFLKHRFPDAKAQKIAIVVRRV